MNPLYDFRDLYELNVLGSYDSFLKYVESVKVAVNVHEIHDLIFDWNCIHVSHLIDVVKETGAVEILSEKRIFVVAPNPKQSRTHSPWRVTHYFEGYGAICEELYGSAEEGIVDVFINYPDSSLSEGKLDSWD